MSLRNRMEALLTIAAITVVIVSAKPACAADTFGYAATSKAPFSYIDISATGAAVLSGQDDSTAILALPFSFHFYGKDYTNLCVSTNGIASFGGCTNDDLTNLDLTAQSPAGNLPLIAPLWMDMTFAIPGSGSIHYQSLGTAGERQFVVQWHRAFALNLPTPFEFQLILFEGSGNIQFQYKTVENSSAAVSKGAGATVGIRGASGHANGNNLQWSYNAPVLNNGESILYVGDVTPPSIVPVVSGTLGNNGWYTGNVGIHWNVSDSESGIASKQDCDDSALQSDTSGTTLECRATNNSGKSSSAQVTIKLDKTRPAISGMPTECRLWPPTNKLVQVAVISAADALSRIVPSSFQVSVTSSNIVRTVQEPDVVLTRSGDQYILQVRSSTTGNAATRLYSIHASVQDRAGNTKDLDASCVVGKP